MLKKLYLMILLGLVTITKQDKNLLLVSLESSVCKFNLILHKF